MFILASGVFSLHYVVGPLLFPCIATSEKQCGGVEGILGKATRDREANSTIRLRCTWLSHGYYWLYIILLLKLYIKIKYRVKYMGDPRTCPEVSSRSLNSQNVFLDL